MGDYGEGDLLSENVHLFKWLPQTDLLYHPKTKAFITHAGYNSVQEAIHAGVPMICLALFGDQPRNAKVTEKLGISTNLRKTEISSEKIATAIREVLENDRYRATARRLARMVRKKPVSPKDLLIKWTEFLAEFKTLENLVVTRIKQGAGPFLFNFAIDDITRGTVDQCPTPIILTPSQRPLTDLEPLTTLLYSRKATRDFSLLSTFYRSWLQPMEYVYAVINACRCVSLRNLERESEWADN
ncbi:hypothetical protein RB195_002845 [Necator americanus]|uniref:UDP-glucuronosyltransferase n=1 Tax=Necator americanus TaxID=51031 RepID=A0ABR1DKW7_NECAM